MDIPLRVPDQLGQQLKAMRKLRGLSQAALGKRLGVGQARIADIEANPALVSIAQMMRIFSVLGAEFVLRAGQQQGGDRGADAAVDQPRKMSRISTPVKPAKLEWPASTAAPRSVPRGSPRSAPNKVAETGGTYSAKKPAAKTHAPKTHAPKTSATSVLGRAARKGSW